MDTNVGLGGLVLSTRGLVLIILIFSVSFECKDTSQFGDVWKSFVLRLSDLVVSDD